MAVRWSGRRMAPTFSLWPCPTGEQWNIASGLHEATIVSLGGGIRAYEVGGVPLLAGYPETALPPAAAGQILAPWPNRLEDGRYEYAARAFQLPVSEPERGTAIHGLARWLAWELVERRDDEVIVGCLLPPQPGYPWPLQFITRWSVSSDGLRASHSVTNVGGELCPFGLGAHPYLWIPGTPTSRLVLQAPAAIVVHTDERGLPSREEPVSGRPLDFLSPRPIGEITLDHTFTRMLHGADGTARTRLATQDGARGIELWQDTAFGWLQLYNGPGPTGEPGDTLAVEPMTCPPNALRTGDSLIELTPGQTWTGSWGMRPYA